MIRLLTFAALLFCAARAGAQDAEKPKKPPAPDAQKLLQSRPEEFIKLFDKNRNGFLEKDELPGRLAETFAKADANTDGKLDRQEVAQWLTDMRRALGISEPGSTPGVDKMIDSLLTQFDANKDGKISRDESRGRMAENFALLDKDKDGFLERAELRPTAEKLLALKKGPFPGFGGGPQGVDFDALDKNADGRLTRDEVKGSPLFARFAEIDANRDERLERREFEAFLRKEGEKKK